MQNKVSLKIANVIIEMKSRFPLDSSKEFGDFRFKSFSYEGKNTPDIKISVKVVSKLPPPPKAKAKNLFITIHFQDRKENWRLQQVDSGYIYKSPLEDKKQFAVINQKFDQATIYVLCADHKKFVWTKTDIIYDFLQVLLINYLTMRDGIFVHGIGLKDLNRKGLLFAGKSGAGKSTTARLWHKHTKAMILNDDRIIVRKRQNKFFIYGTPWHGDFSDYLKTNIEEAELKQLFFIHHAKRNRLSSLSLKRAFQYLYPSLFPNFWDKQGIEKTYSFCIDLLSQVPSRRLGFVNDRSVIPYVRNES